MSKREGLPGRLVFFGQADRMHREQTIRSNRAVWESSYGRILSDEDEREIRGNLCGFISLLARWTQRAWAPAKGGTAALVADPDSRLSGTESGSPSTAAAVSVAPAEREGDPGIWRVEHNGEDGRHGGK